MLNPVNNLQYPAFKLLILALLSLNFFIYTLTDTWLKAVDALVWLVLLLVYEIEANHLAGTHRVLMNKIRTVLVILVPVVFLGYMKNNEWLDVVNSLLWFALIALLEAEIRWPEKVVQHKSIYWLATAVIFTGLLAMVFAWLWQAAWLDAYDAALWLVAFATIEVDFFNLFKK